MARVFHPILFGSGFEGAQKLNPKPYSPRPRIRPQRPDRAHRRGAKVRTPDACCSSVSLALSLSLSLSRSLSLSLSVFLPPSLSTMHTCTLTLLIRSILEIVYIYIHTHTHTYKLAYLHMHMCICYCYCFSLFQQRVAASHFIKSEVRYSEVMRIPARFTKAGDSQPC